MNYKRERDKTPRYIPAHSTTMSYVQSLHQGIFNFQNLDYKYYDLFRTQVFLTSSDSTTDEVERDNTPKTQVKNMKNISQHNILSCFHSQGECMKA